METKQIIIDTFANNNLQITNTQAEKLTAYYALLIEYNQKYNLTNITEAHEVASKHFADSALGSTLLKQGATVLDIGCGAGFPSIPLAILRPDANFVMIDSVNKKINFINTVIQKLNLSNCRAYHTRAQEFCIKPNRENFDYVVARALAPLNILLELCIPFIKQNGTMLAYKSQNYNNEIIDSQNALTKLFAKVEKINSFNLIHINNNEKEILSRCILEIKKQKPTPLVYPRLKNLIKNNPL